MTGMVRYIRSSFENFRMDQFKGRGSGHALELSRAGTSESLRTIWGRTIWEMLSLGGGDCLWTAT